jgi:hypothetical protein
MYPNAKLNPKKLLENLKEVVVHASAGENSSLTACTGR